MTQPPPDPRFPNLFVIGAPKSGTTSLHSALAEVPDVFMSRVKEPGFFNIDQHFRRGVPHYLDSFFGGAQRFLLRGESTPWYLYSSEARQRIRAAQSEVRIRFVVLLRQPTDRAYSMYLDLQRAGLEQRPFEQAVAEELSRSEATQPPGRPSRSYLWASRYATHLQAWRMTFGTESVGVFLTDDLREPELFWARLSSFLGVDLGRERLSGLARGQTNTATGRRWPWVDHVLRSTSGHSGAFVTGARRVVPAGWYRRAAQTVTMWNQTAAPLPHPVPAEILSMLDEHFRSEILALEPILKRSLTHWLPKNLQRGK